MSRLYHFRCTNIRPVHDASPTSKRRGCLSNVAVKFPKRRGQSNQGISLQELNDHLPRLPPRMRTKCGNPAESFKEFLRQKRRATSTLNGTGFMATTSHSCKDEDDVPCLTDVTGKVYRVFSVYCFISVKYPMSTSVYFDMKVFQSAQHRSLRSSGLRVCDCVTLDAKVGPNVCKARFRASLVNRTPVTTPSSSPCPSLHGVNYGGRCNTVTHTVDQDQAIFHAGTVDKPLGPLIKNLADVFTVGDKVRFNAKRTNKTSGKVRLAATTVHLCRSDDRSCAGDSEGQPSGNEVFMSDKECDIQDLRQAKLEEYESREADLEESPAGCAEWDAISVNADSSIFSVKGKRSARHALSEERGFFYPVTESVGTVKFGPRRDLAATAAVEVAYRDIKVIDNLLCEVADGQEVRFDAVQAEDDESLCLLSAAAVRGLPLACSSHLEQLGWLGGRNTCAYGDPTLRGGEWRVHFDFVFKGAEASGEGRGRICVLRRTFLLSRRRLFPRDDTRVAPATISGNAAPPAVRLSKPLWRRGTSATDSFGFEPAAILPLLVEAPALGMPGHPS
ncbi:hypothetical protein HPB48_009382 [Haemaphysalis longicornis]|uniref:Uncharacterized protein n=1 Tax=Haemaphysalis longicornis TaxID=44386 RepID=A0A9J6FDT8_HAELO|nr:hypothetical protein HPB48_009382 [Haemaphysalis longicornis]